MFHELPESTLEVKAAVAVVVRNGLLEEAHTNGPLTEGPVGISGPCRSDLCPAIICAVVAVA
jgi:hypothetical protein